MADTRRILAIGGADPGPPQAGVTVTALAFSEVNARTVSAILPDLVILPLFGPDFDAIEALTQLERFGYSGEVVVRGPRLHNSRIVERELSAVAPALRVRLTGPVI
jgi:hypothetical protein